MMIFQFNMKVSQEDDINNLIKDHQDLINKQNILK